MSLNSVSLSRSDIEGLSHLISGPFLYPESAIVTPEFEQVVAKMTVSPELAAVQFHSRILALSTLTEFAEQAMAIGVLKQYGHVIAGLAQEFRTKAFQMVVGYDVLTAYVDFAQDVQQRKNAFKGTVIGYARVFRQDAVLVAEVDVESSVMPVETFEALRQRNEARHSMK